MNTYNCELWENKFSSKYTLVHHARSVHNIKMSTEEVPLMATSKDGELVNSEEDLITDDDLRQALDEAEFDQMIVEEIRKGSK